MVLVPALASHLGQGLSLLVAINGKQSTRFPLKVGVNPLSVQFAAPISRRATVALVPSFSFVPRQQHLNADTRRLSVVLTAVRAE